MTRRLALSAQQLLDPVDLTHASPRRIGTLVSHEGIMLEVSGFPMPLGSNVRIRSADNDYVYGEVVGFRGHRSLRSEEHTSELQSLMRISYAVFCLKKKTKTKSPTQ